MSSPLPKLYYQRLIFIAAFIILTFTSLISTVLADSKTFTGTLGVDSPILAHTDSCDTSELIRYQLHGAFTVSQSASYTLNIDDYNIVNHQRDYPFFAAYVVSDLNMGLRDILAGHEIDEEIADNNFSATLVPDETYYIVTLDCATIQYNFYDAVNYTLNLSGIGDINLVPAIDRISDIRAIEGGRETIDVQVVDDGTVTIGYQVFDKDNNPVPSTSSLYTTVDNGDGTGTITFLPEAADLAASPYDVTVSAIDSDNNITTRTFSVSVVPSEVTSFSGRIDASSPSQEIDNGRVVKRYQSHGTFTATADGLYQLEIQQYSLTAARGRVNFVVMISAEPLNIWTPRSVTSRGRSRYARYSKLEAGQTYYIYAVDDGEIEDGGYEAVDYTFRMTGPVSASTAPVTDSIRWQYVPEGGELTVTPRATNPYRNFRGFWMVARDKDGTAMQYSTDPDERFISGNSNRSWTFTPHSGDADGSPYTVWVSTSYNHNDSGTIYTSLSSTFTLIVEDPSSRLDRDQDTLDDEWELYHFGCLLDYDDGNPTTDYYYNDDDGPVIAIRPDQILSTFHYPNWAYVGGYNSADNLIWTNDIMQAINVDPDGNVVSNPTDCARERLPVDFFQDPDGNPYPAERWDLFDCQIDPDDDGYMFCIMPAYEQFRGFNDPDDDGISNSQEQANGTDPLDYLELPDYCASGDDTDCDGLTDTYETQILTDPDDPDTDDDGLLDGVEVCEHAGPFCGNGEYSNTDPFVVDTDTDGLSDYDEFTGFDHNGTIVTTDPNDPDSDNDGLTDGEEASGFTLTYPIDGADITVGPIFTDPNSDDTDTDGWTDKQEIDGYQVSNAIDGTIVVTTNPIMSDTDGDGVWDGAARGLADSNPSKTDTDDDGLTDGEEVRACLITRMNCNKLIDK